MPGVGVSRPGADPAGPFRPAVDSIATFFDYQMNPEKYAKPNQRVKPGPMQGYKYDLQPGETQDDVGQVRDASGQPVEFINRPKLATLADLIGYMTGGVAGGAPAGAVGAGAYRRVRDIGPSLLADDPTVARELALKMEAMHKRAAQGYEIPGFGEKADMAKMDKALTSVSTKDPLPRYEDAATRALDLGFDTPMYHATNAKPDPEAIRKLSGSPWFDLDPFVANRGSFYLGDKPSAILKSGAAQNLWGGGKMYPFIVKDVLGEHPMPPQLHGAMPDMLKFDQWGGIPKNTVGDIRDAMQSVPGWGDNMGAAMEAAKEHFGTGPWGFNPGTFMEKQGDARNTVAELLARLYYQKPDGGAPGEVFKIDPFDWRPAAYNDPNLLPWGRFESGAKANKPGTSMTGLHSPVQNEIGAVGFSGARISDEMKSGGGKSIAMIDPTGVRAIGAKFKNPMGDLLSGNTPPGWLLDLWGKAGEQPQQ